MASAVTFAAAARFASAPASLPAYVEWPLMGMRRFLSESMYPV